MEPLLVIFLLVNDDLYSQSLRNQLTCDWKHPGYNFRQAELNDYFRFEFVDVSDTLLPYRQPQWRKGKYGAWVEIPTDYLRQEDGAIIFFELLRNEFDEDRREREREQINVWLRERHRERLERQTRHQMRYLTRHYPWGALWEWHRNRWRDYGSGAIITVPSYKRVKQHWIPVKERQTIDSYRFRSQTQSGQGHRDQVSD